MASELVLKPDFAFVEKPEYSTLVTEFESGYEQRRSKWGSARCKWSLNYVNRCSGDRDVILGLYNCKMGQAKSFTWDHPVTGCTHTVRFAEDSLEIANKAYGLYDMAFQLYAVK